MMERLFQSTTTRRVAVFSVVAFISVITAATVLFEISPAEPFFRFVQSVGIVGRTLLLLLIVVGLGTAAARTGCSWRTLSFAATLSVAVSMSVWLCAQVADQPALAAALDTPARLVDAVFLIRGDHHGYGFSRAEWMAWFVVDVTPVYLVMSFCLVMVGTMIRSAVHQRRG
jgi:hypothetical protein